MTTRRQFLSILAGAMPLIAAPALLLPRRSFFLPPPGGWPRSLPSLNAYLTSPNAWYLKTDHPDGLKKYHRYRCEDLTEGSLEAMCRQIRELTKERGHVLAIQPTHLMFYGPRGR